MSTQTKREQPPSLPLRRRRRKTGVAAADPLQALAQLAHERRDVLLNVHRRRLPREDLEDCYSQATLEMLARVRAGHSMDAGHALNALEQKFVSRILDRRRQLRGRSAIENAIANAERLTGDALSLDPADHRAAVHERVARRLELDRVREVAAELTDEQRLVMACQVSLSMRDEDFCRRYGWSHDKFRKVAQRARTRLTALVDEYGTGERCRRLRDDLLAHVAGVASPRQAAQVVSHLHNCASCRATAVALREAERRVAAMLPVPLVGAAGVTAAGAAAGGGAGGGALFAGGAAAMKAVVATACVAAVTGGGVLVCRAVAPAPSKTPTIARAAATSRPSRRGAPRAAAGPAVGAFHPAVASARVPATRNAPRRAGGVAHRAPSAAMREFGSPIVASAPRRGVASGPLKASAAVALEPAIGRPARPATLRTGRAHGPPLRRPAAVSLTFERGGRGS